MEQPVKKARPRTTGSGSEAQASAPVPEPAVTARLASNEPSGTVLPPASWTATTGWTAQSLPPVPPAGEVVKASRAGSPTVTSNPVLTAVAVVPATVASSRYPPPARSTRQPWNVAVLPSVLTVLPPSQASVAPGVPRPGASARVTAPPARLPPASRSCTVGCVDNGDPPRPSRGAVVKAADAGVPAEMSNPSLSAVNVPSVATST